MRFVLACAAVLVVSGCAGPRSTAISGPTPARWKAEPPPPEVKDPNFILVVSEAVPNVDKDGVSFTKVFVDGRELGKTAVAPRSEARTLKLKLPPGNQPVRLEQWILPGVGEWERAPDSAQPRERFVRIEEGSVARVELRFAEGEAAHSLSVSREAAPR
jgi:hypothetical protein